MDFLSKFNKHVGFNNIGLAGSFFLKINNWTCLIKRTGVFFKNTPLEALLYNATSEMISAHYYLPVYCFGETHIKTMPLLLLLVHFSAGFHRAKDPTLPSNMKFLVSPSIINI